MRERDFSQQVVTLAQRLNWEVYRTWLSIRSPAGFPDLVLVRPPRVIFAELKMPRGRLSAPQRRWLRTLASCPPAEAYIWRWEEGILDAIRDILSAPDPRPLASEERVMVISGDEEWEELWP